jgi:hypothetical protein
MDAAYANADRFNLKTLVLYGLHDEIIPPEPVLRDLHAQDVMADIIAWINEPGPDREAANASYASDRK